MGMTEADNLLGNRSTADKNVAKVPPPPIDVAIRTLESDLASFALTGGTKPKAQMVSLEPSAYTAGKNAGGSLDVSKLLSHPRQPCEPWLGILGRCTEILQSANGRLHNVLVGVLQGLEKARDDRIGLDGESAQGIDRLAANRRVVVPE